MSDAARSVALLQMNCALGNRDTNLDRAEALLAAAGGEADLACLPELFNTGYNLEAIGDELFEFAESIPGGATVRWLCEQARHHDIAIVAGIIEQAAGVTGLLYDTVVLIDAAGTLVGRYRKSHLYPAEHSFFAAGTELPVFDLAGLHVGVAICFEAAFPPIASTLALRGAHLVLNPSAVPVGYGYLQDVRTRARAQDNQCFVAAVNHVGDEGNVTYCGQSQVADPRGDVIALASDATPSACIAHLDLSLIRDQRVQEPIFRGFRPELYQFNA